MQRTVVLILILFETSTQQTINTETIAKFRKWGTENGADIEKVDFKYNAEEDSTTLVLVRNVEPGEMIISIPAALQFPSRVSATSPVPSLIENSSVGRVSSLCLYLIAERALGKNSFWAPWIETLPATFYHALSYSDEEMEHFQESAFRELRTRKIKNVRKEYDEKITPLLSLLPEAAGESGSVDAVVTRDAFSYEAFEWAYSIITTRSIFPGLLPERERPGETPLILLGPALDTVAHGAAAVRILCEPKTGRCDLAALAAMRAGDAVSVGVGLQSNLELLANRGVVLPANPNNFVLLKFQLDMGADMHASARLAMLGQLNLSSPMTYIVRAGEMPQGLLSSLRVQVPSHQPPQFRFLWPHFWGIVCRFLLPHFCRRRRFAAWYRPDARSPRA